MNFEYCQLPMKPYFAYYGGKQRIAKHIIDVLPPHTVYVEPFAGGATILFQKGKPGSLNNYYREVINDINDCVINFYQVISDKEYRDDFFRLLNTLPYSHSIYKWSKDGSGDNVERAVKWFYNVNNSFAKKSDGGWGFATLSTDSVAVYNSKKAAVWKYRQRLEQCYIENIDALKLIKKWDSPHTCFYCDPPYIDTNQGNYSGYTHEQYKELVELLDSIGGSFVLSSYPNDYIPKHWKRNDIQATMSAAGGKSQSGKSRIEAIASMDRSETVERDDIRKHLWSPSKGFAYRNEQYWLVV